MRGIGMAFLVGSSLVMAGCSADNEAEADKLQAKLGSAPKAEVKDDGKAQPSPGSMDEYTKRHQSAPDAYSGTGYDKSSGGSTSQSR